MGNPLDRSAVGAVDPHGEHDQLWMGKLQTAGELESLRHDSDCEIMGRKPWPAEISRCLDAAGFGLPRKKLWRRQAEHAVPRPMACLATNSLASIFRLNLMIKGGQFSVVARGHFQFPLTASRG